MPPKFAGSVEEHPDTTDAVFAALAHSARRQILQTLRSQGGRMTAGEIAQRFSHTWPTTTRHLRVLETAGLVRVERNGRERTYCLETKLLMHVTRKWLRWFEEGV
jgi:DNA-binding transcriptional ArsR family regulator